MKSQQLLPGALAVLVAFSCWQSYSARKRTSELEAAFRQLQGTVTRMETHLKMPVATAKDQFSFIDAPSESDPNSGRGSLRDLDDRLHDLENTVNDLADAWNRFAAEELEKRRKSLMRAWGPEQVTGAPDCSGAGDQRTAWASLAADGGEQWLETVYANPVDIAQVRVLENDNPGAVVRIVAIPDGGNEVPIWEGEEPKLAAPADQVFPARTNVNASRIRVYLDTSKVPGWNEIDAVELIGRDGSRQWATSSSASSSYADRGGMQVTDLRTDGFLGWK